MGEWLINWAIDENKKGNINIRTEKSDMGDIVILHHTNGEKYKLYTDQETVEMIEFYLKCK